MLIVKTLWSVWSRTCPARYRLLASTIEKKPTHFRGFFHLLGKDASDKMEWNPFVMQLGYNSLKCMRKRCFIVSSLNLAKTKDRGKDKKKQTKVEVNLNELSEVINTEKLLTQFEHTVNNLKDNYSKNLTLRSSVGSIEQIPIPWESKEYQLQELSQVARKPKTLIIDVSAFPQVIPNIIQALAKSGMNLNPQQDGTTLFVPIPKITKEHRENLAKNAKAMFIGCRKSIRDIQLDCIKSVKNKKHISEDLQRSIQNQVQALADKFINEAEAILKMKQKELSGDLD
ncbi:ribosome-recycling factor, mitochondrial [Neodiprion fabricii]|uniref:ribosome-recycling factor, mitochondrial n=1 Tax=Neodiprion fabricii TaxID=2872261 RepID=UPI001ED927CF|nr:ribosome-recycling factor, mitochondrial [Neodiprion fabricii]